MYDNAKYGVAQTLMFPVPTPTTVDANEVIARIQWFNNIKLLEARALIVGTAYDDATCTLQLYLDDGSIGAIVISTATVGQILDASLTDTDINSTSSLEIQLGHLTATGVCDIMLQYQEMFE